MLRAGVARSRVDDIFEKLVSSQATAGNCISCERELSALRETVGDGLDALKIDQHTTLKALHLSMLTFRNDAKVYQMAFITAASKMNRLAIVAICLQIVMLAVACFSFYAVGSWLKHATTESTMPYESAEDPEERGVYAG